MIGIVVASHSRALARAATELAGEMVPAERRPRVEVAAGLDEETLGTDASAIAEAVERLADTDGVLVLVDLGSAVLSSQMALEFVDPELAGRVTISPAPLVEGLVSALVTAAGGADLAGVAREAERALDAKAEQLDDENRQPGAGPDGQGPGGRPVEEPAVDLPGAPVWTHVLELPNGLHARPAAALVHTLSSFDVRAQAGVAGTPTRGDLGSITQVQALAVRQGQELLVWLDGPDAAAARDALDQLAAARFGDGQAPVDPAAGDSAHQTVDAIPDGSVDSPPAPDADSEWPLELAVDVGVYRPGDPAEEEARVTAALTRVGDFVAQLVDRARTRGEVETAAVLGAVGAILHDPTIERQFRQRTRRGEDACTAVQETMQATAEVFERMDNPYLRERATDLRALERHLLMSLLGFDLSFTGLPEGRVLVVDELDALTAAQIAVDTCPGIRVCTVGEVGHGVIVARARGLAVAVAQPPVGFPA